VVVFLCISAVVFANTYILEHGLDSFEHRASIEIQFPVNKPATLKVSDNDLTPAHRAFIQHLANGSKPYTVRAFDVSRPQRVVLASVPACAIVASHFHDMVSLHVDAFGNVVGLDYTTPLTVCSGALSSDSATSFSSTVRVVLPKPAEKVKEIRPKFSPEVEEVKQKEAEQPGFFSRYWMYILPIGCISLL